MSYIVSRLSYIVKGIEIRSLIRILYLVNRISHYLKTKNEQRKTYILKLTTNIIGKLENWQIKFLEVKNV